MDGRVAELAPTQEDGFDSRSGRFRALTLPIVRLEEHPANVRFRLVGPLDGELPIGANVRLEVEGDPARTIEAAIRSPATGYELRAVGLAVDGRVVYSAADAVRRAEQAAWSYKRVGILCGGASLVWAGALVWWRRRGRRRG